MYHMGLSFRSVGDYVRGLRTLCGVVGDGREREAWISKQRGVPHNELVSVRFDAADGQLCLLIRVRDVYVIGVRNAQATFYFSDLAPGRLIDNQVLLGFTSHYNDLGKFVSLGSLEKGAFEAAVQAASRWTKASPPTSRIKERGTEKQSPDAKHLLRLILATSEAARFPDIGATVANALYARRDRPLTLGQIDLLVHRWEELSAQRFPVEVRIPLQK